MIGSSEIFKKSERDQSRDQSAKVERLTAGPLGTIPYGEVLKMLEDNEAVDFRLLDLLEEGKNLVGSTERINFPQKLNIERSGLIYMKALLNQVGENTLATPVFKPEHATVKTGVRAAQANLELGLPELVLDEQGNERALSESEQKKLRRLFKLIKSVVANIKENLAYLYALKESGEKTIDDPFMRTGLERQELINRISSEKVALSRHLTNFFHLLREGSLLRAETGADQDGSESEALVGMMGSMFGQQLEADSSHKWQIPVSRYGDFVFAEAVAPDEQKARYQQLILKILTTSSLGLLLAGCVAANESPTPSLEVGETVEETQATTEETEGTVETENTEEVEGTQATAETEETQTSEATSIATPEPTEVSTSVEISNLIVGGSYREAVELTKQAVESGEFSNLNEAILEVWLPVIREQTDYSERVIEGLAPRLSGLAVNEAGLAVISDEEGNILIKKQAPGVSNVAWAVPIMEIANDNFPTEDQGEYAQEYLEGQFENGLQIGSATDLYSFMAVIDDEVQLDPELELPDGKKVTTLMRCYYYDAQGNLQKINIPLYVYDPQEFTIYKITRGIWKRNSVEELNDTVEENKDGVDLNMGPMVIEGIPDLESGDIAYIGFNMEANPSLDSRDRDFFQDAVSLFHTQASLDAFAQTGDPNNLPMVSELQEPLLIPLKARKIGLSPEALRDIMEEDESN